MMDQNQVNRLCEDEEIAFFQADVCLGSPAHARLPPGGFMAGRPAPGNQG